MTRRISTTKNEHPLYFFPLAIPCWIREWSADGYYIHIKQTHYYHVTMRTKSLPRGSAPRITVVLPHAVTVDIPDKNSNERVESCAI